MKNYLPIIAFFFFTNTFAQQKYWRANVNTGEYGSLNTHFIVTEQGGFVLGTTKPGANKRIVGGLKGALAKGMFQRDGSVMELDSVTIKDNVVTGNLMLQKKKYYLKGTKDGNSIIAAITGKSSGKVYGRFEAREVDLLEKPNDYVKVWSDIKSMTEKLIFKKTVLDTKEWKGFVSYMDKFSAKAEDDGEFLYGFFYKGKDLPFSHYTLTGKKDEPGNFAVPGSLAGQNNPVPSLTRIDSGTFLMDIPAFDFRANIIDSLMLMVLNSSAKNLVVDLRKNPGGDMEGGMRLCEYITDRTLYGGVVLSQAYWNTHQQPPAPKDYSNFKTLNNANYAWFREEVKNGVIGLSIVTNPLPNTFKGKIFILTSSTTASSSEPLVYTLQKENIATIIGGKTAGAVLSMEHFYLYNFALSIPVLDYYTFDGKRLDNNGVEPDVKCNPQDAMTIALNKIKEAN